MHTFRNIGFNAFVCTTCKLGAYEAHDVPCPGTPSVACPTLSNAHTHGTCLEVFPSQAAAEAHWLDVHSPF